MHKCPNCGQEYEGKFCSNCGTQWQEEKTCPNCGAKLGGSARFCNECGYSFYKSNETQNNGRKQGKKKIAIGAWIKSHLKIVIPVLVAVLLVIVLACSIPACIAGQTNGTYYKLRGGELDKSTYFILKSGKWEDEDGESGTYKLDGENIIFYVEFFGSVEEADTGTLKDYVLKVESGTFVSEKHKHNYGEWETVVEATCLIDGSRTRSCACGVKEKQDIKASDDYHKIENIVFFDEQYHKGLCTICENEVKQSHSGSDCACGYPYSFSLINDGTEYKISKYYSNSSVTQINIPSVFNNLPVTSIGSEAFNYCSGLTSVIIPESVTLIGESAFYGCSGLTSITIPASVTSIGKSAFGGCNGLTSITVSNGNTKYYSENNCLIERENKKLISGCKNSVIPDGVTSIGDRAFYYCIGLTSITIPNSVTSIVDCAFDHCSGLTDITIPDSVISIGTSIFWNCYELKDIRFKGTKAQWQAIEKSTEWDYHTGNYTVHCTDGDITK